MIDKKRFSIQKVKKVLHKIGKYWAIVTTAIIGLFTGSTMVANNAHANPQTNQKTTNHVNLAAKQDTKSKLVNNNVPRDVSKSLQSNAVIKNQIHDLFNDAVINGLGGSKAAPNNESGYGTSSSVNISRSNQLARPVKEQKLKQNPALVADSQNSARSLKGVKFVNNIINDNIKPNSNKVTHQAALSAYDNLIHLADANNVKQFINPKGMPVGNIGAKNTWLGNFNQFANDINAINHNGYNRQLNRLNNYLQSVKARLINELPVRYNHVNALTKVRDNAHDILLAVTSKETPASQNLHDYLNYKISKILSTNELVSINLLGNKENITHTYHGFKNIMQNSSAVNGYQNVLNSMKDLIIPDKVKIHNGYHKIIHNLNGMRMALLNKPHSTDEDLTAPNLMNNSRNVGDQADNLDSSASLLAESNERSAASSYDNSTSTAVESISTAAQLIANRINNNLDELSMASYAKAAASVASTVKSLISNDVDSNVNYSLINDNADKVEAKAKRFTKSGSSEISGSSNVDLQSKASVSSGTEFSASSNSSKSSADKVELQGNDYNSSNYFHWNDLINKTLFGKMGHRYYDVLIVKPCSIYNNVNFSPKNRVRQLNPGEVIHVNNVIDINQDHVNVNCFELTNWSFITSNKRFTRVL